MTLLLGWIENIHPLPWGGIPNLPTTALNLTLKAANLLDSFTPPFLNSFKSARHLQSRNVLIGN